MITLFIALIAFLLGAFNSFTGVKNNDSELRIIGAVWLSASVIISTLG